MEQEPSRCKEIDQTLMYKQLPAHLIVTNFIAGEEDCDYEIYLRDFLNESSFFMSLSKGHKYQAPDTESHGEPDAISDTYTIDFKLLVATSRMEANSVLSGSITKYSDGFYGFGASKVHGEKTCTNLCQALRYKDVTELEAIIAKRSHSLIEKDVVDYLSVLKKKKNILLFLPVEFSFTEEHSEKDAIKSIQDAISFDLKASIEYREKNVKDYDAYVATLCDDKVLFFELSADGAEYVDCVNVSSSESFMKLYNCGRF